MERLSDLVKLEEKKSFALSAFKSAIELNRECDPYGNVVVSPLSVEMALAMLENGANGDTYENIAKAINDGRSTEKLNSDSFKFVKKAVLKENELKMVNALVINESIVPYYNRSYGAKLSEYYGARLYLEPLTTDTLDKVNKAACTVGVAAGSVLKQIDRAATLYSISATGFSGKFNNELGYREGVFNTKLGEKKCNNVVVTPDLVYEDSRVMGFMCNYTSNCSFLALSPKEESIDSLIDSLAVDEISNMLEKLERRELELEIPEFKVVYDLNNTQAYMSSLNINNLFEEDSDISGISEDENLRVTDIISKAFVEVKKTKPAVSRSDRRVVKLNKPFIYSIIDNEKGKVLFVGKLSTL